MMNSDGTQDPKIAHNLQALTAAKWSDEDKRAWLRTQGADPDEYMGGGDGNGGIGRQLGLAARAGLVGAGNLASLPFAAVDLALGGRRGGPPAATLPTALTQSQGGRAADQLGLPTPENPGERIMGSAVENAVTSLPFAATGPAGLLARGAQVGVGALAGAAGQGAKESGAGPLGQMAASAVVGFGAPLVGMIGPAAIRAALRGTRERAEIARQSMAVLQAGEPNAALTLGQVAPGGYARSVEHGLRHTQAGAERFHRTLDEQALQMKNRAAGITERLHPGGATVEEAARAIQRGISEGFVPQFTAKADQLYGKVWQMLPGQLDVVPANTVGVFTQQGHLAASARPFSEHLISPTLNQWGEDLAETLTQRPQGIPLETFKAFRSKLGRLLSGADMVEDIDLKDVKLLYGAVSEDMRASIAKANPAALPAWDRANQFWKAGADRLEKVLQPLIDKRTPELAFQSLVSGSREGATALRRTMHSLNKAERRLVASSVLQRMGRATPGKQDDLGAVFSPETYLTNWNRYSPEAKDALFRGIDPYLTKDLDALAKAMDLQRKAANVLPTRVGTVSNSAFQNIVTGLSVSVLGAATGHGWAVAAGTIPMASTVGANLASRAFTNPRVIHFLVRQTRVPASAMAQQLAILVKDAQKWPAEDRAIAEEMAGKITNLDWSEIQKAQALADATRQGSSPPRETINEQYRRVTRGR